MARPSYDAVVVGAGPNGLAAAITLAREGQAVLLVEGQETIGGGTRSAELTMPGFIHDVCSAIVPLALASPFFASVSLDQRGLEFVQPRAALAHPLDDGSVALLERSVDATARGLGEDARSYRRLMGPLVADADALLPDILGSLRMPRHPLAVARFGVSGIRSLRSLASRFEGQAARALLAGIAAHSMLPLDRSPSAAVALVLGMLAHTVGWPMARGGSQRIADVLAAHLRSLGAEIVTGQWVGSIDDLPPSRAVLLDVTPRQVLSIAGHRLPRGYRHGLERFRYGPGVFKVDYALDGPVPWKAEECSRAGTVHLGGTLEEIAVAEETVATGDHPERPLVLLAQQSLFDPSRAPEGKHTLWAYCHVPNGSTVDMTERIESQIERFAPGFRERVLARSVMSPADLERHNPNYVGGDINGGLQSLLQTFARPTLRPVPYSTPL
ncbi:MAG TPA: NAD(P)/FAD-dependent oxidoreductase, partial [Actinomycetota bacterium]|nr:NAD(P)/FAD-dependent oxidoreductase [Actinomycetota bacterium]